MQAFIQPFEIAPTTSLRDFIYNVRNAFECTGISAESALKEAHYLVQAALDISPIDCLSQQNHPLTHFEHHARLMQWARARLAGQPLSRLVQKRSFWKHNFHLSPHTLDPRPETEHIIEAVLNFFPQKTPLRILDIGVGTGCILLSLLHEYPNATGIGLDVCPHALEIALKNANELNVQNRTSLIVSDWLSALSPESQHTFDVIVSNPPYIPTHTIQDLETGVKDFDPHLALDGGNDGLDAFNMIIPKAPYFLKMSGLLVLEMGATQAGALLDMTSGHFQNRRILKDLSGHDRILVCQRTQQTS